MAGVQPKFLIRYSEFSPTKFLGLRPGKLRVQLDQTWNRWLSVMCFTSVYLNSALCLKVGQSLWIDRTFSTAVLNAMYSFHASSAYVEFWNNSFGTTDKENEYQITRQHVWGSFVQESVRTIASSINPNNNLELIDTEEAFNQLGQNDRIHSAIGHT